MKYYADGDYALIRVDVAPQPTREGFLDALLAAPAKRYVGGGGWTEPTPGENLASKAINSGDYYPVDETEAIRIQGVLDADYTKP